MMRVNALEHFYHVGGAVHSTAPSYVQRKADHELLKRVVAGDFCYVLTPRQRGKSSLTVAHRHAAQEKTYLQCCIELQGKSIGGVNRREFMQRTADFHNQIADARLSEAAGIVDNTAALDTTVDMLNAYAPAGDAPIRGLLRACELPSSRLPSRHDDLDLVECERQEAQIWSNRLPAGKG